MARRSTQPQPHNFNNQMNNSLTTKKTQGQNSQGRRMGLVCDHCGYKGHTRESCYRIVGFPADFKRTCRAEANAAGMNPLTVNDNGNAVRWIIDSGATHHITCCESPCPLLPPFLDNVDDVSNDVNMDQVLPSCSSHEESCHTHIEEISNTTDGLQESSHSSHNEPPINIGSRKTTRQSKPPVWIKDYVVPHKSKTGLSGAKTVSTPLEFNQKLTSVGFDQHTGGSDNAELEDITAYQRLIDKLLYLTITRPDICISVQVLSQFMQHPKVSHWEAALRVVRYIKKSPGLGVMLRRDTGVTKLTGYCDSDWA
uniref:Reverse transcriptase Ty1/copia-type domain-containing protein n=1 Tax=Solanum lycopersicum TaxID=4081 RepID=A0A3Q7HMW4_SOLLC